MECIDRSVMRPASGRPIRSRRHSTTRSAPRSARGRSARSRSAQGRSARDLGSLCTPGLIRPTFARRVARDCAGYRSVEGVDAQIASQPDRSRHEGPSVGPPIGRKSPSVTTLPRLARPDGSLGPTARSVGCRRTCRGAHHHVAAPQTGRPQLAVRSWPSVIAGRSAAASHPSLDIRRRGGIASTAIDINRG